VVKLPNDKYTITFPTITWLLFLKALEDQLGVNVKYALRPFSMGGRKSVQRIPSKGKMSLKMSISIPDYDV